MGNTLFDSGREVLGSVANSIGVGLGQFLIAFSFYFSFEANDKIEKLTKNKDDPSYDKVVDILCSFLMSENFIHSSLFSQFESLYNIVLICEMNEEFSFLKCLFPLLEKLKIKNFRDQLEKVISLKDIKNDNYLEDNSLSLNEINTFINENKIGEKIEKNLEKKEYSEDFIFGMHEILKMSIYILYDLLEKEELEVKDSKIDKNNYKEKYIKYIYNMFNESNAKEKKFAKKLLDYYTKINIDDLKNTKELYQLFLFGLKMVNINKIEDYETFLDDYDFKKLLSKTDINGNYFWVIIKDDEYHIIIGEKKINKLSMNIFKINDKEEYSDENYLIKGNIYESLCDNEKIIMIRINLEDCEENNISFKDLKYQLNVEINKIHKNNPESKEYNIYIMYNNEFKELNEFKEMENIYNIYLDDEIEQIIKNKSDSYYEEIVDKLSLFMMSDNFVYLLTLSKENDKEDEFGIWYGLLDIVKICESNEKYLFLKCFFPLLEKLKINNFENQLKKIINNMNINKETLNLSQIFFSLIKEQRMKDKLNEKFKSLNNSFIKDISKIFIGAIMSLYDLDELNLVILPENKGKMKIIDYAFTVYNEGNKKEQSKILLDYFKKLNYSNLIYVQEIYQIFIMSLEINNLEEKFYNINNANINFPELVLKTNLNENHIWALGGNNSIDFIVGKKKDKIKLSFNFFEIMNNNEEEDFEEKNLIKGNIYESLCDNEKIIMIRINLEECEENKISFEELKNQISAEINKIHKNNPESKEYNIYIMYNDAFIEFQEENILNLKEIFDLKQESNENDIMKL